MAADPELALWLAAERQAIENVLLARLGAEAPGPRAPESEALRRFRSFAAAALLRGERAAPALEGLHLPSLRTVETLLSIWCEAAQEVADVDCREYLASQLAPLLERFRTALRGTASARRRRGTPRANRRAVIAAIDRVSDVFLAIDADTRTIADANPAAGALLGTNRDALIGADVGRFIPTSEQAQWWTHLDAVAEGSEPLRFRSALRDATHACVRIDVSITRYANRARTLALVIARPSPDYS